MDTTKYDPITRLLHLSVAAGITAQMLTSLVMVTPRPGRLPNEWFEIHENVGIAMLGVVSLFWLWTLARAARRGGMGMLFPWLSRRRLLALKADVVETLKEAARLRLPGDGEPRPLPSAVQGLGLMLALFLAATGTVFALGMGPDGAVSAPVHAVKEAHEAVANVMWAYLVGHPLMGLLHQLAGHRALARMFSLRP